MKALRTPYQRFSELQGWSFGLHYVEMPDGAGGSLRLQYVDEEDKGQELGRIIIDFITRIS